MTITALPTAPSTSDPANFAARADAWIAALSTFVTEANALAAAMNLNSTTDTSASSVLIGLGSKTFTVSAGKSFQPGMFLIIADTSAPTTNSMYGQVTSYSGTSLVMNILAITDGTGSPTAPISAWTISQSAGGGAYAGLAAVATNQSGGTVDATTIAASGLISANGGQIKFPATQNPSSDPNTLDDYEEGTWTPSISATSYITQEGRYTKIGRLVSISWELYVTLIGAGSTTVITGMPFANSSGVPAVGSARTGGVYTIATAIVSITPYCENNSSITLWSRTAASTQDATNAIFKNDANVSGQMTYFTS